VIVMLLKDSNAKCRFFRIIKVLVKGIGPENIIFRKQFIFEAVQF